MRPIHLTARVVTVEDDGGKDAVIASETREFDLPIDKAHTAKAWAMRHFRRMLGGALPTQAVKATITGTSDDGSHHLATGETHGWQGTVHHRRGVFDR